MNCVICINDIEFNDKQTLSCEHIFHKECIIDWFKVKTNNCPVCKCKNTNLIKNPIMNYINPRYNELENLVLNNLNKNWDYSQLTLNSNITKKFVKENPNIPWIIESIYMIYVNDPELCELVLQYQINTISKKRLVNLTKYVRTSFILKQPNYTWNWNFLSNDSDDDSNNESNDSDHDGNNGNEESDYDIQYDILTEDEIPNLNIELLDEDYYIDRENIIEINEETDGESNEVSDEEADETGNEAGNEEETHENNYTINITFNTNQINIEITNSKYLFQNITKNMIIKLFSIFINE